MHDHAISHCYGVLIPISRGYPPVKGRLHTCYAPVRHSSSESKLSMLPFDLHVLGLPLAFILSQDQTLHCSYDLILFGSRYSHRKLISEFNQMGSFDFLLFLT